MDLTSWIAVHNNQYRIDANIDDALLVEFAVCLTRLSALVSRSRRFIRRMARADVLLTELRITGGPIASR